MRISKSFLFLAILFTSFLILSNITGFKISQIGDIHFAPVIIFFPITYIISDIFTEVYGFASSRMVIWFALLANLIVVLAAYFLCIFPPSSQWEHNDAFNIVFKLSPVIFFASMVSYIVGEFLNSFILAKLKIYTKGKNFFLRAMSSSIISLAVDTTIFYLIAFSTILAFEVMLKIILAEFLFKVLFEVLFFPVTKHVSEYLKKKDKVDFYDTKTNFNPFNVAG
jgi:uncharacterized integral membrane protein (TIGR00697 family)